MSDRTQHHNTLSVTPPPSLEALAVADRIDKLIDERGGCMCGHGESCEECLSFSGLNKLRDKLRHLAAELRGKPIKPLTLEEYGRSIRVLRRSFDN